MNIELRHVSAEGLPAEVRHQDFGLTEDFDFVARFDERLCRYASRHGWAAVLGYDAGEPAGQEPRCGSVRFTRRLWRSWR
ncbi:hypothetical protein [Streptomyces tsukubensis]|uniref:hypothetical protein n=1 Tax=Streptomyces tsukubensis TaxID=83656 RepID=UPI003450F363